MKKLSLLVKIKGGLGHEYFMGTASFWKNERVLEMGGGIGCTAVLST